MQVAVIGGQRGLSVTCHAAEDRYPWALRLRRMPDGVKDLTKALDAGHRGCKRWNTVDRNPQSKLPVAWAISASGLLTISMTSRAVSLEATVPAADRKMWFRRTVTTMRALDSPWLRA